MAPEEKVQWPYLLSMSLPFWAGLSCRPWFHLDFKINGEEMGLYPRPITNYSLSPIIKRI